MKVLLCATLILNLVKPLVGYYYEGGERRFDISDRTKVYFDIEVDGVYEGRINLELFDEVVPRTTENFRQLCTRELLFGYWVDRHSNRKSAFN